MNKKMMRTEKGVEVDMKIRVKKERNRVKKQKYKT